MAIATPGTTFPFPFVHNATMPAAPPHVAMSTSYRVGDVLARSSELASLSGEMRK